MNRRLPSQRVQQERAEGECEDGKGEAAEHEAERDFLSARRGGERAVDVLSRVASPRAHDYVRQVNHALQPWRQEGRVRGFVRQSSARGTPRPGGTPGVVALHFAEAGAVHPVIAGLCDISRARLDQALAGVPAAAAKTSEIAQPAGLEK
ncbi:hypothetical protein [Streptomyces sp. NPDC048603]|uniref:hypothetical protein n=1 Tax=Streptomyces sp. NPDC048603 TaxID=3365577 RepID=UPI0037110E89